MSDRFPPNDYPSALASLLQPERLADLGPGTPNRSAKAALEGLTDEALFGGQRVVDADMAAACRSGLWLYHDFLDRSHSISQQIHTTTGSYWHAIMHRREGDYSNSKYWLHRVGTHPVFASLAQAGRDLNDPRAAQLFPAAEWDPYHFVDLCQRHCGRGSPEEELCRKVQQREWELLFDYCYRTATGA